MDGILAACRSEWSRLYFVAWWLVAVVMILNLLVAFVLDVIEEKKEEGRLQGRLEGAEARGDGH